MLTVVAVAGWSSRSHKSQRGGGGDGGAEKSHEDAGHQICGDEESGRGKGKLQ